MSHKSNFDTIVFQYPGTIGEFHEEFTCPNYKYEVTLCPHSGTNSRLLRTAPSASSNFFHLTIKWDKMCRKFVRIRVHDIVTAKIQLKDKILKSSKTSVMHKILLLENKPTAFILEIYTFETISRVKRKDSLAVPKKTDINTPFIKTEFEQLSSEIRVLLDTGAFSDVTMTDGENKMKLHKLILSARSSVFNKMFQHPTKEMQENIVKIPDVPFKVLRVLVEYMYSGVAKIEDMEMARNLFIAADKYDIQRLKEICLAKLKCISLDDVLENFLLANLFDQQDLKDIALTYISNNYSAVQKLPEWNEFTTVNKDLAIGILSYVLDIKTENL